MENPLVTVICLCYNHAPYVVASLESVKRQTYANIELIIVDDASTDNSQQVIHEYLKDYPEITFIPLHTNVGNCKAFNLALEKASGKYVIDLATDDLLLPHRVYEQVACFEALPPTYGVVFSDAELIDEEGNFLKTYYQRTTEGRLLQKVPTGEVYLELIKKAFICSPTMMMRKAVLDEFGGYDETLSYEDYDFWVRSGRNYQYHFQDQVLTQKRILQHSHRTSFYLRKNNPHLTSTLKICYKAYHQNQNEAENKALAVSVRYHMRQALFMEMFDLVSDYGKLLILIDQLTWKDRLALQLAKIKTPLFYLYQLYLKLK